MYQQLAQACDDLAHHIDQARSEMEGAAAELIGLTLVGMIPGLEEVLAGVAARIIEIYERFRAVLAVARVAMVGAEDGALVEAQAMRPIAEAVAKARSFASADESLIAANQTAGNAARDRVLNEFFPNAKTEVTLKTLPNAEEAVIDPSKFENYSMDPTNPNNKGKWQAWRAIGFDVTTEAGRQAATDYVVRQLVAELGSTPATMGRATGWGDRYEVDTVIGGPSGQGTLKTVWQVEDGIPRLITNWLEVHK